MLQRFTQLAKMNEVIFHTSDLANLWKIENKNTLHTTLKRYVQKGVLFRIYKGFYSLQPIKNVNPIFLGIKALNQFAYVSTETVLMQNGIIFQNSSMITLISATSKKFSIEDNYYRSRQLSDKYLFNQIGINLKDGFYQATIERAVADLLYFNRRYFFDEKSGIDWQKVRQIQETLGYTKAFFK